MGYERSFQRFLNDPHLQDSIVIEYMRMNEQMIPDKWIGRRIDSILITRSGILAGCHLGGAGTVLKWLRSDGERNPKDSLGTGIKKYMNKFKHYKINL